MTRTQTDTGGLMHPKREREKIKKYTKPLPKKETVGFKSTHFVSQTQRPTRQNA